MLAVHQIPALQDNYIYFLSSGDETAVIDPSEAGPVLAFLEKKSLTLDYTLITHHHWDHVGGVLELKDETQCKVVGFEKDAHRIPGIDQKLSENSTFKLGESMARILFIPGHTLGHIAYWFESERALFCGDTLFSLGCGRLFEGTPEQMYKSLSVLKSLPDDTLVYCAHEYTLSNVRFALSLKPQDKELHKASESIQGKRNNLIPTIPTPLAFEKTFNPFLIAPTLEEFTQLRQHKDIF